MTADVNVYDKAREVLQDFGPWGWNDFGPWDWNDFIAESVEQVDLVLDKAARAWDEQHSGGTR